MMEQQTAEFKKAILNCLDSAKLVLGAFQERATWFKNILNERNDAKIFQVTKTNRDFITEKILELIGQALDLK